jgi:hypothetical protein
VTTQVKASEELTSAKKGHFLNGEFFQKNLIPIIPSSTAERLKVYSFPAAAGPFYSSAQFICSLPISIFCPSVWFSPLQIFQWNGPLPCSSIPHFWPFM